MIIKLQTHFKILRLTAIVLFLLIVLELLYGFLTTKNFYFNSFVDYNTAYYFHTVVWPALFIPIIFLHSFSGLMIIASRHKKLNNKTIKSILALIWILLFVFFALVYFLQPSNALNNASQTKKTSFLETKKSKDLNQLNSVMLSAKEISRHHNSNDCWIIVNKKVYDVTNYLELHPGGIDTILPYCGKDATEAFNIKNKEKPHSINAQQLLESFYLGELNSIVSKQKIRKIATNFNNSINLIKKTINESFSNAMITSIKSEKNFERIII